MFVSTHGITARPTSSAYGTLTTAWIAATGETDLTILGALNTLESNLTTYGLTSKMKALYPFVGGTAAKHKFNFMDARDLNAAFRLIFNGGITHSSNGVQFGGVNGWAETNLTTSAVLGQNSTHLSLYSRTNNGIAVVDISGDAGVQDGTPKMYINFGGTNTFFSVNQANNSIVADGSSSGMRLISRINSTNEKLYKNGSVLLNSAQTSAAFGVSNTIQISNYAGSYRSNRQYAFASIGNGLTDTEAANLYTAVQTFQTALSRNV